MKSDHIYLKVAIVILGAVGLIVYSNTFDDYLHPYIENQVFNILTPIVVYMLIMKLVAVAKLNEIKGKNFIQLFIQMLYELRYGIMFLMIFACVFNPFSKELALSKVLAEYYEQDSAVTQTVTVYEYHDNVLYDHQNLNYHFYHEKFKVEPGNTYQVTYLKDSKIVTNIKGPINSTNFELEDTVQVTKTEVKDDTVTLKWKTFNYDGKEVEQYRIEGFTKQKDGSLLRSGSQIVVEDGKTSATIKHLIKGKEYQFTVSPLIKDKYDETYKGTSSFVEVEK